MILTQEEIVVHRALLFIKCIGCAAGLTRKENSGVQSRGVRDGELQDHPCRRLQECPYLLEALQAYLL